MISFFDILSNIHGKTWVNLRIFFSLIRLKSTKTSTESGLIIKGINNIRFT